MASKALQRQIDEQRFAEGDEVRLTVREMLKLLHTGLPGIVKAFDPATQTARIQPAIKKVRIDDDGEEEEVALGECPDVPVHFPGGGGYVLTFPVAAGDPCLLVFAERAIDFWLDRGGLQRPSEYRMHDYSDGFAFVGFRPKPEAVADFASGACELRSLDGTVKVSLSPTGVVLGGDGPTTYPVLRLTPAVTAWLAALNTATGAVAPADWAASLVKAK